MRNSFVILFCFISLCGFSQVKIRATEKFVCIYNYEKDVYENCEQVIETNTFSFTKNFSKLFFKAPGEEETYLDLALIKKTENYYMFNGFGEEPFPWTVIFDLANQTLRFLFVTQGKSFLINYPIDKL